MVPTKTTKYMHTSPTLRYVYALFKKNPPVRFEQHLTNKKPGFLFQNPLVAVSPTYCYTAAADPDPLVMAQAVVMDTSVELDQLSNVLVLILRYSVLNSGIENRCGMELVLGVFASEQDLDLAYDSVEACLKAPDCPAVLRVVGPNSVVEVPNPLFNPGDYFDISLDVEWAEFAPFV